MPRPPEAACGTVSFHDARGERLKTLYLVPESGKVEGAARAISAAPRRQDRRYRRRRRRQLDLPGDPVARNRGHFWHACEHLRTASDHAVASDWFERYREVLRHDPCGVDKVIRALRHLRDSAKPDRAEIERELAFFRKHRQRMRYHALKAEGVAIGSGVVEAANKTLVTQRMKRSGMRWRIAGGQAVLTFRALIKSARFDRAWKAIIGPDTPANDNINPCRHRYRCLNSMNEAPAINDTRLAPYRHSISMARLPAQQREPPSVRLPLRLRRRLYEPALALCPGNRLSAPPYPAQLVRR